MDELISASKTGNVKMVKTLLNRNKSKEQLNIALDWALRYGKEEVAKYLIEKGADINHRSYSPLSMASKYNMLNIVKLLIEKGADPKAHDNWALAEAVSENNLDIARFLLEHGANSTNQILRFAIYSNIDMLKLLIEHGADNNKLIKYAEMEGISEIIDYLLKDDRVFNKLEKDSNLYQRGLRLRTNPKFLEAITKNDIKSLKQMIIRNEIDVALLITQINNISDEVIFILRKHIIEYIKNVGAIPLNIDNLFFLYTIIPALSESQIDVLASTFIRDNKAKHICLFVHFFDLSYNNNKLLKIARQEQRDNIEKILLSDKRIFKVENDSIPIPQNLVPDCQKDLKELDPSKAKINLFKLKWHPDKRTDKYDECFKEFKNRYKYL